ncbi:MAG: rhomboid family intramembrane serine protease [Aeoliella sp.]
MGLYDRDYAHGGEPGIHLQPPKTITTQLVLITACVYGLQIFVEGFSNWFALDSGWFREPWKIYALLSYGFLHDVRGVEHILFNMLMLWMFGREIEHRYGRREFLLFYLWAIVFAGLFWSISESSMGRPASLIGASGGVSGLFVLYALNFPHRKVLFMFIIPMPMWVAALIIIGIDINGAIQRTSAIACTAHLAGAVAGLYYYKFGFSPFAWIADRFSGTRVGRRPKLRVHQPSDDDVSETDDRVDEILRKIQEQGQDSLTWRERRILEKASQQYQRKRP